MSWYLENYLHGSGMRDQSHEAVYLAFILTRLVVALGPSGSRFGSPNTQTIQRHALEDRWQDEEAPVAIVFWE